MQYIQSFLKYLQFEKRGSHHTITSYRCDLNQFVNFLGENNFSDWSQINSTHIRQWMVNMLDSGILARSVNRKVATLKSFFHFLMREGVLDVDPTLKIITPKVPKRLPVFVREAEMDMLLDQIDFGQSYPGVRNRLIIDLFYCSGMRLSELSNLQIRDVDLSGEVFKVLGKRNKQRIIPFTPALKASIVEYMEVRTQTFPNNNISQLFLTDKGEAIYNKLIYRVVKQYLTLVTTLAKRSPHILRHTFATALLNRGADLNAIKELLGHSNLSATAVYTHNSFEQLTAIYNQAHPRA